MPIANGVVQLLNTAEEAVTEELSFSEELFTSVVLEQDNYKAATSCFRVYYTCQSCYGRIFVPSDKFNSQQDEFICQRDEVNCQKDEFNCQKLY